MKTREHLEGAIMALDKAEKALVSMVKLCRAEWFIEDVHANESPVMEIEESELALAAIRAELADMPDDNGWLLIADAPKDGDPVLIYKKTGDWEVVGIGRWQSLVIKGVDFGGWIATEIYDVPGVLGLGNPTHYRPIPKGPNGKG